MDVQAIRDYCINSAMRTAAEHGKSLDYSDDSIAAVGAILSELHTQLESGAIDEKRAKTLAQIFGVYVGEVLRCNHNSDFQWRNTLESGLILIRDESTTLDPVASARRHIISGGEESVSAFYSNAVQTFGAK